MVWLLGKERLFSSRGSSFFSRGGWCRAAYRRGKPSLWKVEGWLSASGGGEQNQDVGSGAPDSQAGAREASLVLA